DLSAKTEPRNLPDVRGRSSTGLGMFRGPGRTHSSRAGFVSFMGTYNNIERLRVAGNGTLVAEAGWSVTRTGNMRAGEGVRFSYRPHCHPSPEALRTLLKIRVRAKAIESSGDDQREMMSSRWPAGGGAADR